jgi:hypothetical protein
MVPMSMRGGRLDLLFVSGLNSLVELEKQE